MSKWGQATPAERENAPASIFCGPGRSFPVADQEDVNNAVSALGRAGGNPAPIKACIIRRANANSWSLPDAWTSSNNSRFATFDLADGETRDGVVIRTGKLFQAGVYEDKDFAATVEDLYIAASRFVPVANDLEHMPTILDGHLGTLDSVT